MYEKEERREADPEAGGWPKDEREGDLEAGGWPKDEVEENAVAVVRMRACGLAV